METHAEGMGNDAYVDVCSTLSHAEQSTRATSPMVRRWHIPSAVMIVTGIRHHHSHPIYYRHANCAHR